MRKLFTFLLLGGLLFVLLASISELPPMGEEGNPSYNEIAQYYIDEGANDTGTTNLIAGIITDYRAFDTLGEATVLFTGIAAVVTLIGSAHHTHPSHKDDETKSNSEDLFVRVIVRMILPFIQIYGLYVIIHGHLSPGGAFSGGAIFAASIVLYTLAFGLKAGQKKMPHDITSKIETGGILTYIAFGFVGVFFGYSYLTNQGAGFPMGEIGTVFSAGFIPIVTIVLGLKVLSTIVTLFHTMLEGD